jgi:hypothetical protein
MVCHTQNYWVFGLFPSSGIIGTRKHDVSETGSVSVFRCRGKIPTQMGPLDRANLNHWASLLCITISLVSLKKSVYLFGLFKFSTSLSPLKTNLATR